jgi:hypothetical protein
VRVVDLTPAEPTAQGVLDALRKAPLSPSDLRSRVLFLADGDSETDRDVALMTYAALLGYAKRRLDASFELDGAPLPLADFDKALRRSADLGRPEELPAQLQVGGPVRDDLPHVDISSGFSPALVTAIRYARRVRFCPSPLLALALPQLVAVAALRGRGESERLPFLTRGDEPVEVDESGVVGVCLNTLRRDGEELRRSLRSDNRDAVADKVELTARQQRLLDASNLPVEQTLRRLGARSRMVETDPRPDSEEAARGEKVTVELWHCLRPENHTHNDATPSARVSPMREDLLGFRCFRCLPEKVDSLRLLMWAHDLSADEAADWLLAG